MVLQESDQPLTAVKDLISQQTGIPTNRQVLVVKESKRLVQGSTFQVIATAWKTRKGIRSLILGLVNFALLPQAVSRYISTNHV